LDFIRELERLLAQEPAPVADELTELAAGYTRLLAELTRKASDISLQVEEIYDIIKDNSEASQAATESIRREASLVNSIIAICDIVENFEQFARAVPDLAQQAEVIRQQCDDALTACGITRIGTPGDAFNNKLHSVGAAVFSAYPFEHVAQVLHSGYEYRGKILRKAAIAVSKGAMDNAADSWD
jgi:molecular chaperone GrpE (heat shock protein)